MRAAPEARIRGRRRGLLGKALGIGKFAGIDLYLTEVTFTFLVSMPRSTARAVPE